MYSYMYGEVTEITSDKITLEVNNIGYEILVGNPFAYHINESYRIYMYQHVREDALILFGFASRELKQFFLKILAVKGIGPKSALTIIASFDLAYLIEAIDSENVAFLKKIPGVGSKSAQQIILDLKGKLVTDDSKPLNTNADLSEALSALKHLGYTATELTKVKKELEKQEMSSDEYVKKGLQLLINF